MHLTGLFSLTHARRREQTSLIRNVQNLYFKNKSVSQLDCTSDRLTYLLAATATTVDRIVVRLSFPPKPPPILLTRITTLLAGTPSAFATRD